jgi:hypothetical protein
LSLKEGIYEQGDFNKWIYHLRKLSSRIRRISTISRKESWNLGFRGRGVVRGKKLEEEEENKHLLLEEKEEFTITKTREISSVIVVINLGIITLNIKKNLHQW